MSRELSEISHLGEHGFVTRDQSAMSWQVIPDLCLNERQEAG